MSHRVDEARHYALSLGVLSAFTIGAESRDEQDDLRRRTAAANVA
jgi:1-deoxyxylulose-5-phosphate synthase